MSGKRRAAAAPKSRRATKPGRPAKPGKGSARGSGKAPRGRRGIVFRLAKWSGIAFLVLALLGVGGFVFAYQTTSIPDPNADFQTQTSFIYYADGKRQVGKFATQNRESVSLDDMPAELKDAVVAAENRSFWTDSGIDPKGIVRAAFSNAQGNSTQGASTITQQFVKILYLTQERTLTRKAKEAVLSLKVQRQFSKAEILEGYLNTIYFGRGAYGVQAASRAYFDKPVSELGLRESAFLASVLNNPYRLDPANGSASREAVLGRYRYTLDGMVEMGNLDAARAQRAETRLPTFPKIRAQSAFGGQRGHMMRLVREELLQKGFSEQEIDGGGLRVTTTFSRKAMYAAQKGAEEQRPEGAEFDKDLHVAVASVQPGTGALRGFYGGQDFLRSEINWASAGGQAGSTFKAFAVAAGLKAGYSLNSTFDGNSPLVLPDGSDVENEGFSDYGSAITLTSATQNSVNTAFVDLTLALGDDGPQQIVRTARAMGIPPNADAGFGIPRTSIDLQNNIGVSLGSAQISPINMANAYATLADRGRAAPVHVVTKVEDRFGKVLYQYRADPERALSQDVADDTSYALQQVVQGGSGRAALNLGRPAAGKTGTATNAKGEVSSAWFVGYTPQLATAVMYVRGEGRGQLKGWLPEYFGGAYPARTWTDVMERALEGEDVEQFAPPARLEERDPPSDDHDPVAPAQPAPQQPEPSETASESPSSTPTRSPSRTPSRQPTPTREPTPTPTQPEPSLPGQPTPTPSNGASPSPAGRSRG